MKSDDEIIEFIKKKKFIKFKPNKKNLNQLNKIFSNSKNYDASVKIATHWQKFQSNNLSKKNNLIYLQIRNKLKYIKQKLSSKIYNEKFTPITNLELNELKNILIKVKPEIKDLKFTLIGPRLINIKRKI